MRPSFSSDNGLIPYSIENSFGDLKLVKLHLGVGNDLRMPFLTKLHQMSRDTIQDRAWHFIA